MIPREFTIFANDVTDFSSEYSINALSANDIEIHKLSRFIFPREDAGPTEAGRVKIPELRLLEYAVNLACHKLDSDVKTHWDSLCGRDIPTQNCPRMG